MGTSFDYSNADHTTIYAEINGGAGGEPVVNASDGWRALATELLRIQLDVDAAVHGIAVAQQGASADAATAATEPLVPWVSTAREIANQLAANVTSQEEYFARAKADIQPVPEVSDPSFTEDASEWFANKVDFMPGLTTQQELDQRAAQAAAQRAREVMDTYQSNSNGNLETRPMFVPPPTVASDLAAPGFSATGSPGSGGGGGYAPAGGGAPIGAAASPAAAVSPVSAAPQLSGGGSGAATGGATPGAATPGAAGARPVGTAPQLGGPGADQLAARQPAPGTASSGLVPPLGGAAAGSGGRSGQRFGGGRSAGGGGGVGRVGGGAAGGFGPRGGAGAAAGGGGLAGSGADAGARAGGSAPVGRGGPGGMGAGMVGAGAGASGHRDSEHRRPSWLIEQDENAITGSLPPTLPAGGVIGADPPEDW